MKENLERQMTFEETQLREHLVFTEKNPAPIVVIYGKLKKISARTSYEFTYGRTTLYHLLKKLGFAYQKTDNRKIIMEAPRIVAWRWEHLRKIEKFRAENYVVVYLNETQFDSRDTARVIWSDNTVKCSLPAPPSKKKGL